MTGGIFFFFFGWRGGKVRSREGPACIRERERKVILRKLCPALIWIIHFYRSDASGMCKQIKGVVWKSNLVDAYISVTLPTFALKDMKPRLLGQGLLYFFTFVLNAKNIRRVRVSNGNSGVIITDHEAIDQISTLAFQLVMWYKYLPSYNTRWEGWAKY